MFVREYEKYKANTNKVGRPPSLPVVFLAYGMFIIIA